ncbi:hypothetical protein [Allonocardiopsis opalescens]|uniref:Nucleotidyltransferase-like protein n=1 Tax=Allonocardiopsis opalescens TaxID=1144618 RepID=A0A2T0PZ57_9ACTN|nr:hypothetical protein [Allonocardiopsis opalescens]PRX96800.1 hypothetical protein CLV72_107323 [Allonocardiopsis opalescens]
MDEHLVEHARRLVVRRFPGALAAALAGSAAAGRMTASSDLDVVVLVGDGGVGFRETVRAGGRLVELFVHTPTVLDEIFAADAVSRRATMQTMWAHGRVLLDTGGAAQRVRARARDELRAGPPALAAHQVEERRYGLTAELDDLGDARDPAERLVVATGVLDLAADLLCDHRRAWVGSGKWRPRRLREADAELGGALLAGHLRMCAHGEAAPLAEAAAEVLGLVGGPLREGYRREWPGDRRAAVPRRADRA